MHDYQRDQIIDVESQRLWNYLSDVAHLPGYFARMQSAELVGKEEVHTVAVIDVPDERSTRRREVEGTAWFRRDPQTQQVEWGSEARTITTAGSPSPTQATRPHERCWRSTPSRATTALKRRSTRPWRRSRGWPRPAPERAPLHPHAPKP